MIDPQYLKHDDLFIFDVHRSTYNPPVVTANLLRRGMRLLRSPDVVHVFYQDSILEVDSIVSAIETFLPHPSKMPENMEIVAVEALRADGSPILDAPSAQPASALERLSNATRREGPQAMEPAVVSGMWRDIARIVWRVVDRDQPRDSIDCLPPIPPLGLPPVGSAVDALKEKV